MPVHFLVLLVAVSVDLDAPSALLVPNACAEIFVATPPEVRLVGPAEIVAPIGEPYEDPGATASSRFFGDLSGDIVTFGRVDTFKLGVYHVVYVAHDPCGNHSVPRTRTVHVGEPPEEEAPAVRGSALFLLTLLVVAVACARMRSMRRV